MESLQKSRKERATLDALNAIAEKVCSNSQKSKKSSDSGEKRKKRKNKKSKKKYIEISESSESSSSSSSEDSSGSDSPIRKRSKAGNAIGTHVESITVSPINIKKDAATERSIKETETGKITNEIARSSMPENLQRPQDFRWIDLDYFNINLEKKRSTSTVEKLKRYFVPKDDTDKIKKRINESLSKIVQLNDKTFEKVIDLQQAKNDYLKKLNMEKAQQAEREKYFFTHLETLKERDERTSRVGANCLKSFLYEPKEMQRASAFQTQFLLEGKIDALEEFLTIVEKKLADHLDLKHRHSILMNELVLSKRVINSFNCERKEVFSHIQKIESFLPKLMSADSEKDANNGPDNCLITKENWQEILENSDPLIKQIEAKKVDNPPSDKSLEQMEYPDGEKGKSSKKKSKKEKKALSTPKKGQSNQNNIPDEKGEESPKKNKKKKSNQNEIPDEKSEEIPKRKKKGQAKHDEIPEEKKEESPKKKKKGKSIQDEIQDGKSVGTSRKKKKEKSKQDEIPDEISEKISKKKASTCPKSENKQVADNINKECKKATEQEPEKGKKTKKSRGEKRNAETDLVKKHEDDAKVVNVLNMKATENWFKNHEQVEIKISSKVKDEFENELNMDSSDEVAGDLIDLEVIESEKSESDHFIKEIVDEICAKVIEKITKLEITHENRLTSNQADPGDNSAQYVF